MTAGPAELRARLAAKRAHARRVLWAERIWPRVWPAVLLLAAAVAASLFRLPQMLPVWAHLLALVAAAAILATLLWRGLRPLRAPTEFEIDRRLERASGLAHRPLLVLDDAPAAPGAAALWQAHVERAAAQVARLRVGAPRLAAPSHAVQAGRAALVLLLVAGFGLAGTDWPSRLRTGFWPGLPAWESGPAPLLQAWLTPPGYTGLPPVFLRPDQPAVSVPAGSHLTVSLTGGTGEPTLSFGKDQAPFAALDAGSWQAERDIADSGELSVRRRGGTVGHWVLTAIPDTPPVAAWAEAPGPNRAGRRLQTRLPFTAADDYGLVKLEAQFRLKDRPSAPPLVVAMPLPGGSPKDAKGAPSQDLSAHPWAGLAVVATLVATDALGQHGSSAPAGFILPERVFRNPLARAVIDIRRRLSVQPDAHDAAAADLTALAEAPAAFDNNTGIFLALSSTATLLSRQGDEAQAVEEAQARLWALALQLEDDSVARTAKAVDQARDALRQSVEKGDRTEMDRKAEALRREIARHLQALAEKARKDGTLMPFDPSMRTLNQQDFNKLTREMQEAAKAGRTEEAQQKLQQLEKMLEQLKQAEANPSGDRQQARQQRQQGQQQMGAAEDMIAREGAMKEHATGRSAQDDPASRQADATQQRALRRALGTLMQRFGDLTGKVPDALSEADLAMRDAGTALAQADNGKAAAAHQRAIDALKKGEQQMSQQMASSLGISVQPGEGEGQGPGEGDQMGQNGDEPGDGRGDTGDRQADAGEDGEPGGNDPAIPRDPLGRPTRDGTGGRADGGTVHVPDQMEQARTREIQTELRRREGERTRPPGELDYIERLLRSY